MGTPASACGGSRTRPPVLILVFLAGLLLLPTTSLQQQPQTRYVNNQDATCQGASPCYATIQAGVDAAQPGDTVHIQAGTYQEQVTIRRKNHHQGAIEADRIFIEADPAAASGSVVLRGRPGHRCRHGEAVRLEASDFVTLRGLTIAEASGPAIALQGGRDQNQAIHLERNRLVGNGSPECDGGIVVGPGSADILIANNLIYANGRNGITFEGADGGPHVLIGNTIHGNQWNGVRIGRDHTVLLVNNIITGNGIAPGTRGGRFGVGREGRKKPDEEHDRLLHNLVCGNRLGEFEGPVLDPTDAQNLTPTGSEGPGVRASPNCELPATVYAHLPGLDDLLLTLDDDFALASGSPGIDHGFDPRTLGLNSLFNSIFEADFTGEGKRPRDRNGDGIAAFDLGALEFVSGTGPTVTGLHPAEGVHGRTVLLTVTGTNLAGATALTFLKDGAPDDSFTVTGLQGSTEGTRVEAEVTIALAASLGPRIVRVTTPAGRSDGTPTPGNTFTVLGQLALVPDFVSLVEGQQGGLTVTLSAPAPAGGLTVSLTSAAPGIAAVPTAVTVLAGATTAPTAVTALLEGTANVTVTTPGFSPGQSLITVQAPAPTLTGFDPTSGKVGAQVTLTGTGFRLTPGANSVSFTGANNTRMPALVSAATATRLTVTVPAGAVTGPLQVTTSGGTALSTGHFVVLASPDFTLIASPATAQTVQGSPVHFALQAVPQEGFTGLVSLAISGLPPGATALFSPQTLGPNQVGTLSVTTSGGTPPGLATLTVTGSSGTLGSRSVAASVEVLGAGATTLVGRVLDEDARPLPGVTIRLGSQSVPTDAGGNFVLRDPPTGPQLLFLDGGTVSVPGKSYPIIPVSLTIQAGVTNTLPYQPFLHAQKAQSFVDIGNSAVERVVTDPALPGVQLRLPAGVSIIGWDGQPNTVVSIRSVPIDRLPITPPPPQVDGKTVYMFYFGKQGGGTPTQPIPVTLPNDLDLLPGDEADLWFFDEAPDGSRPNAWAVAGPASVSPDGATISTNPGVGIPRFCCGAIALARRALNAPRTARQQALNLGFGGTRAGEPVDVATGLFVLEKTDLLLPGRLPLALSRTYRSNDPSPGPFGRGSTWPYDVDLITVGGAFYTVIFPGNARARLTRQPDGSYLNDTEPALRGARLILDPGTQRPRLRFKDGTTWTFSLENVLVEITDRNGNGLSLTRDSNFRLVRLSDGAGRAIELTRDAQARITELRDPLNRTVRYTYTTAGDLETVTDPAGGVTRYTYDPAGRLLTVTDPRGIAFLTNEYDAAGRVVRQTQADGGVWTFAYTTAGGLLTETRVTDPRGHGTTYRFNSSGYLIGQRDALGQATTFLRAEGTNLLLSTTDPLGRVTTFTHDPQGNVTGITDPAGHTRTFTFEATFNRVTSLTDPLGNTTTFEYDTEGNLIAITDPEQNLRPEAERLKTRLAYNLFGQPIATTDPLGHTTTFAYDTVGNLTAIADPLGHTTTRTYDAVSRLLSQTDPRGKTTRFAYDGLNRLTQVVDALNGLTRFTYDGNGNLLTVTDARGSTNTHEYDPMDRLSTRTDPLGRQETFTYDGVGNLVETTDRKGQTSAFTYDSLNRRTQVTYADGATATVTYDAAGRLLLADDTADPHRPIAREYDALDRLLTETTSLGTVVYQYDRAGRRTQMTVAGHAPVSYNYDANSRLRTLSHELLAPVKIDYDPLGRRAILTLSNGVSTEYQYDLASRLTALIYRNALGVLGDLTYAYDAASNRIAVGGTFARTLLPDPVSSATYDDANQQLAFSANTMAFDPNGNLTTLTDPSGTTMFTWDSRDRLTALSGPGVTGAFAYDAQGRRVRREISGELREYQYDGADIVREVMNGSATIYLRGRTIDEAFIRIDASTAAVVAYLADALGSTLALTDASGSIGTSYDYEPFGRAALSDVRGNTSFQFTGRENDGTGAYYYRARYYHPQRARFISEDPLGHMAGEGNLYAYVGNNPVSYVDPFGLDKAECKSDPAATRVFFTGIQFAAFLGSLSGPDYRGIGKEVTLGIAWEAGTWNFRRFTSVGVANPEDPEDQVGGINVSIGVVLPLSHVKGSFSDFAGESRQEAIAVGPVEYTSIETSSGRRGSAGTVSVGPSVAGTRIRTFTTFPGCPR